MPLIKRSVCPAYFSEAEPTPGKYALSFSQQSWNQHFFGIFAVSLAQVLAQFKFCNQMAEPEVTA